MARILLLGANGQVGWELRRSLLTVGDVTALSRDECDLADADALAESVRTIRPAIIVNAAAYTAVDKAESEAARAVHINAGAPAVLADEAKRLGALLVDYSTDYVFDGTKNAPYTEEDIPKPINVYGSSKLEGLRAIEQSGCRHLVFRVSWVYGRHGASFVKTILRLARERDELTVVADQFGSPTPADLIADLTAQALLQLADGKGEEGLFNLVPHGETSWHGFAQAIVRYAEAAGAQLKLNADAVRPITTAQYPTPALRPANSRLDTHKLRTAFGVHLPRWEESLPRIVPDIVSL